MRSIEIDRPKDFNAFFAEQDQLDTTVETTAAPPTAEEKSGSLGPTLGGVLGPWRCHTPMSGDPEGERANQGLPCTAGLLAGICCDGTCHFWVDAPCSLADYGG